MNKRMKQILEKATWTVIAMVTILVVWQVIVTITPAKKTMPAPGSVLMLFFKSFIEPIGKHTMPVHVLYSLSRVFVGFFLASICGIVVGIVMGRFNLGRAIIKPIFEFLRPIPPIAWIPLAILWFGIGESTKYFIIFLGAFTQVTLNSYAGALRVDPVLIGAARMLGANEKQIFKKIVFPSALPQIFAGLQVGLSTSWMASLAAEMVRSSEGTGWIIIMGSENGNTSQVLVGMIAIALTGLFLAELMRAVERRLCSWNVRGT